MRFIRDPLLEERSLSIDTSGWGPDEAGPSDVGGCCGLGNVIFTSFLSKAAACNGCRLSRLDTSRRRHPYTRDVSIGQRCRSGVRSVPSIRRIGWPIKIRTVVGPLQKPRVLECRYHGFAEPSIDV